MIGVYIGTQEDNLKNNMNNVENEEVCRIMKEHDVDEDIAEKAQELIDEGLDEDEAIEIAEEI